MSSITSGVKMRLCPRRLCGLGTPPAFQKYVCGKKLYNYDALEPSERKLVL